MRTKSTFKCKLWMYKVTAVFFERARTKNKSNSYNFQVERLTDIEQHKTTFLFLLYSLLTYGKYLLQCSNSHSHFKKCKDFEQNWWFKISKNTMSIGMKISKLPRIRFGNIKFRFGPLYQFYFTKRLLNLLSVKSSYNTQFGYPTSF